MSRVPLAQDDSMMMNLRVSRSGEFLDHLRLLVSKERLHYMELVQLMHEDKRKESCEIEISSVILMSCSKGRVLLHV